MNRRAGLPRLVAATDEERLLGPDFEARLGTALDAGLPAVLVRSAAGLTSRAMLGLLDEVRRRCRRTGAELWVGDRVDLALACAADAVQLPEHGLSIAGARVLAPDRRIGRSVHDLEAARESAQMGADHLVVGAIFPTASHPGIEAAGPSLLRTIRGALGAAAPPLLAIGGLTPERVEQVTSAGASGVVAIRAIWETDDPGRSVGRFLDALALSRESPR